MKKIITLLTTALLLLAITGCSINMDFDNEEEPEEETTTVEEDNTEELEENIEELEAKIEELEAQLEGEEEEEEITYEPEETKPEIRSYINITSPEDEASFFMEDPIEFYGSVSENATKIVVTASFHELVSGDYGLEEEDQIDIYTLQNFNPGDTTFVYRASYDWDNLGHGENTYVFTAYYEDGSELSDTITINNEIDGLGKPVIYLYPKEITEVFVNVEPNRGFIYSEPEIGEGWNVIAHTNGLLYDLSTKSFFPYLYWEGYSTKMTKPNEGFVVEEDSLEEFFEEKLALLGLNSKEIRDFLEFWSPRMGDSPYYLITFIDQEELDRVAPLTIDPEPDTIVRVFFDYESLEEPIEIQEQKLEPGIRQGFTVIEWGGSLF